jgi:hypothetical protein
MCQGLKSFWHRIKRLFVFFDASKLDAKNRENEQQ